jgi:molecular chaperone Hsp33
VRVYAPQPLTDTCRCSRERVVRVLRAMPESELDDMKAEDGLVHVTCEFCTADYVFDDSDLAEIYAGGSA